MENDMKKAILFSALFAASVMWSSQVMAQGLEASGKNYSLALSFEQLKDWIFSARPSTTSRAKTLPAPDNTALPLDPTCSNAVTEAFRGIPPCDKPPVPPSPPNPDDHQKPGTCRSCTNDP
jgi:hypothetical protein